MASFEYFTRKKKWCYLQHSLAGGTAGTIGPRLKPAERGPRHLDARETSPSLNRSGSMCGQSSLFQMRKYLNLPFVFLFWQVARFASVNIVLLQLGYSMNWVNHHR